MNKIPDQTKRLHHLLCNISDMQYVALLQSLVQLGEYRRIVNSLEALSIDTFQVGKEKVLNCDGLFILKLDVVESPDLEEFQERVTAKGKRLRNYLIDQGFMNEDTRFLFNYL